MDRHDTLWDDEALEIPVSEIMWDLYVLESW